MVRIHAPFHGAVLCHRHGRVTSEGLVVAVEGEAPLDYAVTVNGAPARRAGTRFYAEATLRGRETEIEAVCRGPLGEGRHAVRVVWDRYSRPRYRFSIDDNSFFLRDIAFRKYRSLFDCFYLKALRELNRKYGAKFSLNCYFTTGAEFSLPQFPDCYKGEWADNADWLKLSFHAYANEPDRPYQYTPPEKLAYDWDLVANEILRFAGERTWATPTVIHWGMVQPETLPMLRRRGVRVLSGFYATGHGYDVNYFLDDTRSEYMMRHDALMDFESGIVFSLADITCNNVPVDKVRPLLEGKAANPDTAEIMDLFTHEQYFWPFYPHYVPDHVERLEAAIGFCAERGYEPVWLHEGFLGVEE